MDPQGAEYPPGKAGVDVLLMNAGALAHRLQELLQKYRWAVLILTAGAALMLLTPKQEAPVPEPTEQSPAATEPDYCGETERRLARILSEIDGAGEVEVMLTLKSGPAKFYQTDVETRSGVSGDRTEAERSEKTVLFSNGSAYNEPALVRTDCPSFLGALIVAPGAEDPAVQYALIQAVSSLLGLGTDQITVVRRR